MHWVLLIHNKQTFIEKLMQSLAKNTILASTSLPSSPLITTSHLRISGDDALSFLQNVLINDINTLAPSGRQLNGLCNVQGRVFALFWLQRDAHDYVIELPAERAAALQQKLQMYILRSDVQITASADAEYTNAQQLDDIRQGIPQITNATAEKFLPQMLNLDALNGMSFTKGCYPGQEIVIRTQHKGQIKRRTRRFTANIAPPTPYTTVLLGEQTVGHTLQAATTAAGCELLAVVNEDAPRDALVIDGQPLNELPLPYEI